ncbi:MAG: CotH kinase family protein [Candidatus Niyogibacteria bacterium]|nr:CotH kinase family protein [Candidatus Niyogibacteria bacterium]
MIRNINKQRYVKYSIVGGVLVFLFFNTFLLAVLFAQESPVSLITNPYVKKLLPTYRGFRELGTGLIDLLYLPKMFGGVDIPDYRLEIDPDDYRFLNSNLPDPFSDEVLKGEVWLTEQYKQTVPAKFVYHDRVYDVDVRYRGENPNHWTEAKRSWQIGFKKKNPFDGLRTIKLIIPTDRDYFVSYLNSYRGQKFSLAVPEKKYVTLHVNGKDMGVYYQIEDWSDAFLEKQQLPTEANLYITEDDAFFGRRDLSAFIDPKLWNKQTEDSFFSFSNFAEIDMLIQLLNTSDAAFFEKHIGDIVDLENFYLWNMVSLLAGSKHQSSTGNMRLYFNTSKGKFEIIPWDVGLSSDINFLPIAPNPWECVVQYPICWNRLVEKILGVPAFAFRQKQILWEYVSQEKNLEDDLAFYDKIYYDMRPHFYADFVKIDSNFEFDRRVQGARALYIEVFHQLRSMFEIESLGGIIRYDGENDRIDIILELNTWADLSLEKIVIPFEETFTGEVRIMKGGEKIASSFISSGEKAVFEDMKYLFRIAPDITRKEELSVELRQYGRRTFPAIQNIEVVLRNAFTGKEVGLRDALLSDERSFSYFEDIAQTPQEFISKHPFFFLRGNEIAVAGTHVIDGPIIVPKNTRLHILPGSTLLFGPRGSLISYSSIEAKGTAFAPITFRGTNAETPWGSVGIANVGNMPSVFEYARFEGGSEAYINGIFFSGMLSSYHSDVEIRDSVIRDARADDGINVKYATAHIERNQFLENSFDGIDLDFSDGIVADNTFEGHGGDAIDLSGSALAIRANAIKNAGDKCISIGEKSLGDVISNNMLTGCAIGIAVKDSSTPKISSNEITGNGIGINAYRKKEVFGGGMPELYDNNIHDNGKDIESDEFSKIIMKEESYE